MSTKCDCTLPDGETPETWTCEHGRTWHRRIFYLVTGPTKLDTTDVKYLPVRR